MDIMKSKLTEEIVLIIRDNGYDGVGYSLTRSRYLQGLVDNWNLRVFTPLIEKEKKEKK